MCGICGFLNNGYSQNDLFEMNQTISHRGPDDEGYYFDEKIALAQKRLSIIDLSSLGRQPMSDRDNKITITFNGEIYNYQEIKEELLSEGYVFETETDTEVIIYAYLEWGINCVKMFNGMFAIAIWEHEEEKLTLVRDRIGIKPMYYYSKDNDFIFSSELKPILKHPSFNKRICMSSLNMYLTFGYIPSPYSIYENTYKLEPGSYLVMKNNMISIQKYWEMSDIKKSSEINKIKTEKDYLDELEFLIKSSIKYRLVSDVNVGAFLSGGIDSSLVVAIMQSMREEKVKTFSIGFENDAYNEAKYAKEIAEYIGTDHTEFYISQSDMLELVDELAYYYDEPFYDSSAIPTMLVSRLAKQKVTVALSGDGGDEQFYGYNTYDYLNRLKAFNFLPYTLRRFVGKTGKIYNKKIGKVLDYKKGIDNIGLNLRSYFSQDEIHKILKYYEPMRDDISQFKTNEDLKELEFIEREMILDLKSYMVDDVLTKVDRASMKYALEARVPLLDHRIVEFSLKLPLNLKKKGKIKKYLLKQILYKYLPKKYTDRPKKGFSVPIDEWMAGPLKEQTGYYFGKDFIDKQGIFNFENFERLITSNGIGAKEKWLLFSFQKWYEYYFTSI